MLNENGWEFYEEEFENEEEVREQISKRKIDFSAMGKNMTFREATALSETSVGTELFTHKQS